MVVSTKTPVVVVAASVALLILFLTNPLWIGWGYAYLSGSLENNKHVNPPIFQAFCYWEGRCLAERWPYETVRCQGLLNRMDTCGRSDYGSCTTSEYYDLLWDLGFDLPPYYEPGYKPKGWFWFL